jgi:hypothetical protein
LSLSEKMSSSLASNFDTGEQERVQIREMISSMLKMQDNLVSEVNNLRKDLAALAEQKRAVEIHLQMQLEAKSRELQDLKHKMEGQVGELEQSLQSERADATVLRKELESLKKDLNDVTQQRLGDMTRRYAAESFELARPATQSDPSGIAGPARKDMAPPLWPSRGEDPTSDKRAGMAGGAPAPLDALMPRAASPPQSRFSALRTSEAEDPNFRPPLDSPGRDPASAGAFARADMLLSHAMDELERQLEIQSLDGQGPPKVRLPPPTPPQPDRRVSAL